MKYYTRPYTNNTHHTRPYKDRKRSYKSGSSIDN
jgi:hypothetical protein